MWNSIWYILCFISAVGNFILAFAYRDGWGREQDVPKAIFALLLSIIAYKLRRW
jgi:hypothetical protein